MGPEPARETPAPVAVRAIHLPTLMTEELHTAEQICEHARRHHPDKTLALVAIKSHVCDFSTRACLKATRDLCDTCNTFVHANFALYQARMIRNSPDGEIVMQEAPVTWEIADEWSHIGPLFIVLDLLACSRAGEVTPVTGSMAEGDRAAEVPVLARLRATRDALAALPVVAARLSLGQRTRDFDPACLAQPEPTTMAVWRALEVQADEESRRDRR